MVGLHAVASHPYRVSFWVYYFIILIISVWGGVAAYQLQNTEFILPTLLSFSVSGLLLWAMCAQKPSWQSWIGVLQFAASWIAFLLLKAIQLAFPRSWDHTLLSIDRYFLGKSLTEYFFPLENKILTEIMSVCYLSFYLIVLLPVLYYGFQRKSQAAYTFLYGLMLMYLFGFLGYLLIPAAGPYAAFPQIFPYPPEGGAVTAFLVSIVARGGTGMDVFPSLHTGIGLYVLGYLFLSRNNLAAYCLLPWVLGLIMATLYLRYHYGIDVLVGAMLAVLVLLFLARQGLFRPHHTGVMND